jgi:uncharacterized protein (TIRG00374 family)
MSKKLKIAISFTISIFLMWLSARGIAWGEFHNVLANVSFVNITLLILINIAVVLIRPYRWQILLADIFPTSYRLGFNYTNIGFLANSVLPARAGELVRPVLFAQKVRISKVTVITTVIVERLLDIVVLLAFLVYALFIIDLPLWAKRSGAFLIGLSVVSLLLLLFLSRKERIKRPIGDYIPRAPERMKTFISSKFLLFQEGLTIFHSKKDFAVSLIVTVLIWAGYVLSIMAILSSFSYDIDRLDASIVMMVFVSLSIMIPSSPGHFGTFQFAAILALGLFGIPKTEALAISLLVQVPIYLLNVMMGVASLFWEGVSLNLNRGRGQRN